ncbi:MAG: carboxypeptidase regulatory-like domain-containing protein [Cyanobacteria bacterium J06555_13]
MRKSVMGGLLILGLLFVERPQQAIAHGAIIEVTQEALTVEATFDNGDPMAEAQVSIYSPADLKTPWAQGQTNEQGQFSFSPDSETPGQWEVTVRQAGHGGTTTFEVGESTNTVALSGAGASPAAGATAQKWVSVAAVIWGFIGTALFFSRKSSASKVSASQMSGGEA